MKIPLIDAPNTFLIPISLSLLATANEARPNKPRQAIQIATPENTMTVLWSWSSEV